MISFYGFALMGVLFAGDCIYEIFAKETGFLQFGKPHGVSYALPRLFLFILLPYWLGTFLVGENNMLILLLLCFSFSASMMGLEYFTQKKTTKDYRFRYIPALFAESVIALFFICDYAMENTAKVRLYYSLFALAMVWLSCLAYSSIKSKVSDFRYGRALTVSATAVSSLTFGLVLGVLIRSVLG